MDLILKISPWHLLKASFAKNYKDSTDLTSNSIEIARSIKLAFSLSRNSVLVEVAYISCSFSYALELSSYMSLDYFYLKFCDSYI